MFPCILEKLKIAITLVLQVVWCLLLSQMDTQGFILVQKQKKFENFEKFFLGYQNFRQKFFVSKFHH